ncbi:hypothetical protein C8R44DRAFT_753423 [Mycena epipterygia]|nr:hypothetical protein C8R44DRAFT_753423 [Mycena epipterygia]
MVGRCGGRYSDAVQGGHVRPSREAEFESELPWIASWQYGFWVCRRSVAWASRARRRVLAVVSWEGVVERSGAKRSRTRSARCGFAAAERVQLQRAPAAGESGRRRQSGTLLIAFVLRNKVRPSSLERMTGGGGGARTGGARRGVGGTMTEL